jgi:type IV pilus assembly protein PilY1
MYMKRTISPPLSRPRSFIAAIAIATGLGAALPVAAALIDLSQGPLASSSSTIVKPNISFVLDTSGSMAWSHAPDESQPFASRVGYKSAHCNSVYYRPDILYVPPKNADGTDFPNATFTAAWKDGYKTGSGTVNLGTSFYAYDNTSSSGAGTDTAQPAYYYLYTGTQTPNFLNTTNQFYKECDSPESNGPTATITVSGNSNSSVSSIKVNGVQLMSGTSSSSSNRNTVASNVANKISLNGYDATSSSNVITVTGPASAVGFTPVITKSGGMSFTATAFIQPPFTKVIVSATSGPSGTDERQNFANWFSYYRIRILMMKSGAGRAFASIGSNYRVGFMTIYATPSSSTTDANYLAINDFDATQKASWYSKFYAESPGGSTPLKTAFSTAGRNFAGKLGPDPIQYSCQQNSLILTTDGYWNAGTANAVQLNGSTAVGNQDNNATATPRPMYDGGLSSSTNTLADAAAYYYNTDLRTTSCNSGPGGADVCANNVPVSGLDNAAWQHMTTFTLGLGVNGQLGYTSDYLTGGSADYNAIVSGSKNWPTPTGDTFTTIDDLWHAAVNGHGQYFSAKNPDLLVSGLRTALAGVSAREAAGAAAATSNLEPVAGDNSAFVANYRTVKWDGDVQSRSIDLVTGAISATPNWSAQALLDGAVSAAGDSRTLFTFLAGIKVAFAPSSFSAAQKLAWFTPNAAPSLSQSSGWTPTQTTAATADTLINYLRGENGFEERSVNTTLLYRTREHVLGDIINGKPVYVKVPPFNYSENNYQTFKTGLASRQGVVYVAANDGMLHAFDAVAGTELWAYVPSFVLPNLKALADDNYPNAHQFYVDGSPTASDVWTGSAWKTILVGGLNGGGKGYYALDITNPATPTVLWEFSDTNLGYSYGNPVVGKLTDGTWVAAFTSGYNNTPVVGNTSADGVGRLYVLNAVTGALKFTLSTGVGNSVSPSGLGKISAWVNDGLNDNTIQRVYGGDMVGNLWRFDINDVIPPSGKEATQLALFQVGTYLQPVTTAPELGVVNNKPMVYVGTGRYLGASDVSDQSQQSLYAIVDQLNATGIGNARTETTCPLVQQTLTIINTNTRSTSTLPVDLASKCGWFLDFNPGGPAPSGDSPGERVNVDPKLQLGVLAVATNIPQNNVCTVGGSSFLYFFDYSTGQFVSTSTGAVAGSRVGNSITVGLNTYRLPDGRVVTTVTTSDDQHPVFGNPNNPLVGAIGKRVLWRELLN